MDKDKSKKYEFNLPLRIKEVFLKKNPKEKSNKEEQCKSINNNERRKFLKQIKDQNGSAIQVAKKIQMLSDIENNENKLKKMSIEELIELSGYYNEIIERNNNIIEKLKKSE